MDSLPGSSSPTPRLPVKYGCRAAMASSLLALLSCGGETGRRVVAGTPTSYRATLDDPTGDDTGPGSYSYPRGAPFPAGTFDLRSVTIAERGQDLEVTVQIRGEFREWDYGIGPQ